MLVRIVVALLVVFPIVISYPGNGSSGRTLGATTRIVNGRIALKNEIPYMVAVGHTFVPDLGYFRFCGGSIFNSKFIITAAHCFRPDPGFEPEEFAVMAGGLNTTQHFFKTETGESGVQVIRLKSIVLHEGFDMDNEKQFRNDIAVLELERPLVFNEGVQPIPIPPAGNVPKGKARVSGWGDTKKRLALSGDYEAPEPSDVLLTAEVDIIPRDQCDRIYKTTRVADLVWWSFKVQVPANQTLAPIAETLLCAADLEGGQDVCGGDSGGPLQCSRKKPKGGLEKYLCGVASSTVGCGLRFPAAFADVAMFHDWILNHTKSHN